MNRSLHTFQKPNTKKQSKDPYLKGKKINDKQYRRFIILKILKQTEKTSIPLTVSDRVTDTLRLIK